MPTFDEQDPRYINAVYNERFKNAADSKRKSSVAFAIKDMWKYGVWAPPEPNAKNWSNARVFEWYMKTAEDQGHKDVRTKGWWDSEQMSTFDNTMHKLGMTGISMVASFVGGTLEMTGYLLSKAPLPVSITPPRVENIDPNNLQETGRIVREYYENFNKEWIEHDLALKGQLAWDADPANAFTNKDIFSRKMIPLVASGALTMAPILAASFAGAGIVGTLVLAGALEGGEVLPSILDNLMTDQVVDGEVVREAMSYEDAIGTAASAYAIQFALGGALEVIAPRAITKPFGMAKIVKESVTGISDDLAKGGIQLFAKTKNTGGFKSMMDNVIDKRGKEFFREGGRILGVGAVDSMEEHLTERSQTALSMSLIQLGNAEGKTATNLILSLIRGEGDFWKNWTSKEADEAGAVGSWLGFGGGTISATFDRTIKQARNDAAGPLGANLRAAAATIQAQVESGEITELQGEEALAKIKDIMYQAVYNTPGMSRAATDRYMTEFNRKVVWEGADKVYNRPVLGEEEEFFDSAPAGTKEAQAETGVFQAKEKKDIVDIINDDDSGMYAMFDVLDYYTSRSWREIQKLEGNHYNPVVRQTIIDLAGMGIEALVTSSSDGANITLRKGDEFVPELVISALKYLKADKFTINEKSLSLDANEGIGFSNDFEGLERFLDAMGDPDAVAVDLEKMILAEQYAVPETISEDEALEATFQMQGTTKQAQEEPPPIGESPSQPIPDYGVGVPPVTVPNPGQEEFGDDWVGDGTQGTPSTSEDPEDNTATQEELDALGIGPGPRLNLDAIEKHNAGKMQGENETSDPDVNNDLDPDIPVYSSGAVGQGGLISENMGEAFDIQKIFQEMYPYVNRGLNSNIVENIYNEEGVEKAGRALGLIAEFSLNKGSISDIPHEHMEIYIKLFKDAPIIQRGIKEFGGTEGLVEAVTAFYMDNMYKPSLKQKVKNWLNRFILWLRKNFKPEAFAKDKAAILSDIAYRFGRGAAPTGSSRIASEMEGLKRAYKNRIRRNRAGRVEYVVTTDQYGNNTRSILYDDLVKSMGKKQAYQHYLETKTARFRKWFGNSIFRDKNGEPLVTYIKKNSKNTYQLNSFGSFTMHYNKQKFMDTPVFIQSPSTINRMDDYMIQIQNLFSTDESRQMVADSSSAASEFLAEVFPDGFISVRNSSQFLQVQDIEYLMDNPHGVAYSSSNEPEEYVDQEDEGLIYDIGVGENLTETFDPQNKRIFMPLLGFMLEPQQYSDLITLAIDTPTLDMFLNNAESFFDNIHPDGVKRKEPDEKKYVPLMRNFWNKQGSRLADKEHLEMIFIDNEIRVLPRGTISKQAGLEHANPTTGIAYPKSEIMNFLDYMGIEYQSLDLSADVHSFRLNKKTRKSYFKNGIYELNKTTMNRLDGILAGMYESGDNDRLRFVFTPKTSDSPELLIGFVPEEMVGLTRDQLMVRLQADKAAGFLGDEETANLHIKNMMESAEMLSMQQVKWQVKGKPVIDATQTVAPESAPLSAQESGQTYILHGKGYTARTRENVADTDVTIAIAKDFTSRGEQYTKKLATQIYADKGYVPIQLVNYEINPAAIEHIVNVLNEKGARSINIAGNAIDKLTNYGEMTPAFVQRGIDNFVLALLSAIKDHPRLKNKIQRINSGMQSGVDEAGAKAAVTLGIPFTGVIPNDLRIRQANGSDITSAEGVTLEGFLGRLGQDVTWERRDQTQSSRTSRGKRFVTESGTVYKYEGLSEEKKHVFRVTSSADINAPIGSWHERSTFKGFFEYSETEHTREVDGKKFQYNPHAYAQVLAWHDMAKNIFHSNYLTNFANVQDLNNRLRIFASDGVANRELGDILLTVADPEAIEFYAEDALGNLEKVDQWFEDKDENGEHIPGKGRYKFDGWGVWSPGEMAQTTAAVGNETAQAKTVISFNDNTGASGYGIGMMIVKFMAMNGYKNMQINRKGNGLPFAKVVGKGLQLLNDVDGTLLGHLSGFVTTEEAKKMAGEMKDRKIVADAPVTVDNVIRLPRHSERIKMVKSQDKGRAPFPFAAFDKAMSTPYLGNDKGRELILAAIMYAKKNLEQYTKKLFSFKTDPQALWEEVYKKASDGAVKSELQLELELIGPDGIGVHTQYVARQIDQYISNSIIGDGMYKMRSFEGGNGSQLYLKPRFNQKMNKEELLVSPDSDAMLGTILKKYNTQTGQKLKMYGDNAVPRHELADLMNTWLVSNPQYMMVHRQPIQQHASLEARKIKFSSVGQGMTAVANEQDVYRLHEADHDGDTLFLEIPTTEHAQRLVNALVDVQTESGDGEVVSPLRARHNPVELSDFDLETKELMISSRADKLEGLEDVAKAAGAEGRLVNAGNASSIISAKNFTITTDTLPKGVVIKAVGAEERSILPYMRMAKDLPVERYRVYAAKGIKMFVTDPTTKKPRELDTEAKFLALNEMKKKPSVWLETTKEHEFGILMQMAVDNSKYGYLSQLGKINPHYQFNDQFILKRIFYRSDNVPLSPTQLELLRHVYNQFIYSSQRKGRGKFGKFGMSMNIEESIHLFNMMYDEDEILAAGEDYTPVSNAQVASNYKAKINKEAKENFEATGINSDTITGMGMTNTIAFTEFVLTRLGSEWNKHQKENEKLWEGGTYSTVVYDKDIDYNYAHVMAMQALYRGGRNEEGKKLKGYGAMFEDAVKEGHKNPKMMRSLGRAIMLAEEMGQEYHAIFREVNERRSKRKEEIEAVPSHDYNDDATAFISKWQPIFNGKKPYIVKGYESGNNNITDFERLWTTIYYMNGIALKYIDKDNIEKVTNTGFTAQTLPYWLRDNKFISQYYRVYSKFLLTPSRPESSVTTDDTRYGYSWNEVLDALGLEVC